MRKPAAAISLAIHAALVLLLFSLAFHPALPRRIVDSIPLFLPTRRAPSKPGGGGQRQPLPATRGHAPPMATHRVWVPPMVVHSEHPVLIVEQALAEVPEVNIADEAVGDPLGKLGIPSGGPGGPLGIGGGGHDGVGIGDGPRLGATPPHAALKLTRRPQLIYKEEPEYSEEARKARFQGTVVLAIDVETNGRPIHIRVIHSLGLGLDERAIQAVERWKFRPALAGDRAVVAPATVEVSFRLL